ncbi:beta-microseminoprotein-like isoform X2 [Phyllobates terribilis]|uniref:beta-microseminoprotein-like isoform X1 n=1 Tax=Phyllobates terribilis TaxID=111132 RepID=UPI003CCB5763
MKCLVSLLLSAGVFIGLCNASCYSALPPALIEGETLKGCLHDQKLYQLGAKWRDDNCLDCSCNLNGVKTCCTCANKPVNYDPERCFFKLNKKTCKYELMPNEDPEKQCLTFGSVG